jgi:predicted extracellular nuclease
MAGNLQKNYFSVAFYNVENFFDPDFHEFTLDRDYTPEGKFQWNEQRYRIKQQHIAAVISQIGSEMNVAPPVFLGLAEIENKKVLSDLVSSEHLVAYQYDFVHHESPDLRGVDVAFIYQKRHFELIYSKPYSLLLYDHQNMRDYTRDILLVCGNCFGSRVYVIINHWPSRNDGKNSTEEKRIKAAKAVHEIISEIKEETPDPVIFIIGDFNDNPKNKSVKNVLMTGDLVNPMSEMEQNGGGSLIHLGKWHLFDQLILSKNLFGGERIRFESARIFNPISIQDKFGRHKGPLRTFAGRRYIGGYSDHFPVYAYFSVHN